MAYLDSFQMSFLPDGYEYRVEAPKPEPVLDARDQHLIRQNLNKATGGR